MQKVNEIISKNIDGFIAKIKAWQGTMYNVKEYGLVGDGVTDDTAALQALINLAISEGRKTIFFPPGTYYVTSLVNDDKVFFVGDNATFTGGYTGVINQFGGGELNQNAFSKVNNLEADNPTDALTIAGGVGITVSTNPNTKTVTVTATGTATPGPHGSAHTEFDADPIPLATTTEGGLMSASDKAKLDAATSAATPNTIVQRDPAGRFKAAAPSASDDVARKAEVDSHIATLVSGPNGVHGLQVETGSWTPQLRFDGSTAGITYAFREGRYTRIANVVYWTFEIELSSKGSATGFATIAGLPFIRGTILYFYHAVGRASNISVPSGQWLSSHISGTTVYLTTNNGSPITSTDFSNNSIIYASGFYFI